MPLISHHRHYYQLSHSLDENNVIVHVRVDYEPTGSENIPEHTEGNDLEVS